MYMRLMKKTLVLLERLLVILHQLKNNDKDINHFCLNKKRVEEK